MSFVSYVVARAKEPSTMAGLALIAGAVHTAALAGGSRTAWGAALLQVLGGVYAALQAEAQAPAVGGATGAPTASLGDQVASMAAEMGKISAAVTLVASVAPAAVRDTIGK